MARVLNPLSLNTPPDSLPSGPQQCVGEGVGRWPHAALIQSVRERCLTGRERYEAQRSCWLTSVRCVCVREDKTQWRRCGCVHGSVFRDNELQDKRMLKVMFHSSVVLYVAYIYVYVCVCVCVCVYACMRVFITMNLSLLCLRDYLSVCSVVSHPVVYVASDWWVPI